MGLARKVLWIVLAGGSLLASGVSFADRSEDSMTSARVKVALLNAEGIDGLAIAVETVDGVVTLGGRVATEEQKALAEATTRAVAGVREVRNRVEVSPDAARGSILDSPAAQRARAADGIAKR